MNDLMPDNAMLVMALQCISDGVCISDMDDLIIYVNDSFTAMYGYTREELLGKPVNMIRSDRNNPEVIAGIFPGTLIGGWQGEVMNRKKDGTEFPVYISTSVIPDAQGNPIAMIGTTKDITDIKRMQARFRLVADLFRNLGTDLAENIQIIVDCVHQVIGGLTSVYSRLDPDTLSLVLAAGHDLPNGLPGIVPAQGRICYETMRSQEQGPVAISDLTATIFKETDPIVREFGFRSYLGSAVFRRGKIIGFLSVMDTCPRHYTREETDLVGILAKALSLEEDHRDVVTMFATSISQSPTGIIIADAPGTRILVANPKAAELLRQGREIPRGMKVSEAIREWNLYHPDGSRVKADVFPLIRAVEQGATTENEEMILGTETGTRHVVLVNAAPVRDHEGNISGGVMIFHDVTAKQKAEHDLKVKMTEMERFNSLMIGREMKMIELKKEVNELLVKAGKPEKYRVTI